MIGKTLGHYQITSQIGKGGMGEVFQAKAWAVPIGGTFYWGAPESSGYPIFIRCF